MRMFAAVVVLIVPATAWAQAGPQRQAAPPAPSPQARGAEPYDLVAADRDLAWRINRVTGDVMVCRVDTTRIDAISARCAPAAIQEPGPQQSRMPGGGLGP